MDHFVQRSADYMADSKKVIDVSELCGLGSVVECDQPGLVWIDADGANSVIKEQN